MQDEMTNHFRQDELDGYGDKLLICPVLARYAKEPQGVPAERQNVV